MTNAALVVQIAMAFKQACREHDWEVAELLLQALEAIAGREGNDYPVESAFGELLEQLPWNGLQ